MEPRARSAAPMKLSDLITPELVLLPLAATDKWQAIELLAKAPASVGRYGPAALESVHQALVVRERSMSTGMEHGIAIPHAAVEGLEDVVAVLGLSPQGIPFETLDGKLARIVVCLLIPRSKKLMHIKTLAEIARLLARADVRERLLECRRPQDVVELLRQLEASRT
jgi:mannitol/fructose-specific phosphotransferase system IIA component (Ntr-type)